MFDCELKITNNHIARSKSHEIPRKKSHKTPNIKELIHSAQCNCQPETFEKNFLLQGFPVNYNKRISYQNFKTKSYLNINEVHSINSGNNNSDNVMPNNNSSNLKKKENSSKKKGTSKLKGNSGGVHKATVYHKDKPQSETMNKKQNASNNLKARSKTKSTPPITGGVRIPLAVHSHVFPNRDTNLHNFPETPLFVSTEEAQRVIRYVLNVFDRHDIIQNEREENNLENSRENQSENYLQDSYNYLYHKHFETLCEVVSQSTHDVEIDRTNTLLQRRSLHIHQNFNCGCENDNKYKISQMDSDVEADLMQESSRMEDSATFDHRSSSIFTSDDEHTTVPFVEEDTQANQEGIPSTPPSPLSSVYNSLDECQQSDV